MLLSPAAFLVFVVLKVLVTSSLIIGAWRSATSLVEVSCVILLFLWFKIAWKWFSQVSMGISFDAAGLVFLMAMKGSFFAFSVHLLASSSTNFPFLSFINFL